MSEERVVDGFRQTPGAEPPLVPEGRVRVERRRGHRAPPKTLQEAHAMVQAVAKRQVENNRWVRIWKFVEQCIYLLALVCAYLLYYLIDKLNEVMSLPGLGF